MIIIVVIKEATHTNGETRTPFNFCLFNIGIGKYRYVGSFTFSYINLLLRETPWKHPNNKVANKNNLCKLKYSSTEFISIIIVIKVMKRLLFFKGRQRYQKRGVEVDFMVFSFDIHK